MNKTRNNPYTLSEYTEEVGQWIWTWYAYYMVYPKKLPGDIDKLNTSFFKIISCMGRQIYLRGDQVIEM